MLWLKSIQNKIEFGNLIEEYKEVVSKLILKQPQYCRQFFLHFFSWNNEI
jgi:hypothetical protein